MPPPARSRILAASPAAESDHRPARGHVVDQLRGHELRERRMRRERHEQCVARGQHRRDLLERHLLVEMDVAHASLPYELLDACPSSALRRRMRSRPRRRAVRRRRRASGEPARSRAFLQTSRGTSSRPTPSAMLVDPRRRRRRTARACRSGAEAGAAAVAPDRVDVLAERAGDGNDGGRGAVDAPLDRLGDARLPAR